MNTYLLYTASQISKIRAELLVITDLVQQGRYYKVAAQVKKVIELLENEVKLDLASEDDLIETAPGVYRTKDV